MLQIATVIAFIVSEILRESRQGGGKNDEWWILENDEKMNLHFYIFSYVFLYVEQVFIIENVNFQTFIL